MAANPFGDLALKYVLADDQPVQLEVAKTAAAQIEAAATTTPPAIRNAVGQWVASINRWLGSQPDDEDDVISRAKALAFLARTLEHLSQDVLKADQIKLLIGFFCSLFSSDHRAGIEASSQALGYLSDMKAFQPTTGNDIINGIIQLGSDDFKRQTPTTRLEIYQLVRRLLLDPLVANDLAYRHGNTSGFMTALVELCRNERDPQNLTLWFEIQKLFLQNFSPADEVADEIFKTFSAYFPITLRASATPSGITVDDLKRSLRSCFSAHYRVARLAVPFLLNKLDQGEAVTVSVKIDILQTLEACLAQYSDVKQGIAPYTDQIWSSLKYEVRNGEIHDSIEATLRTIAALAKRLDEQDLQTFIAAAWIDLSDDLSNETYTESAGQLLAAISGSSRQSFSMSTKQSIPHIVATIKHAKSATHQAKLLGVLNALLQVRTVLSGTQQSFGLEDALFSDTLFDNVFAPSWSTWTQNQYSSDRPIIITQLIEGMSYVVTQRSSDGRNQRLCSDATCNRVFSWLGTPSIIYPLEGKNFLIGSQEREHISIIYSATEALRELAPLYPRGYQQLLERFLASIYTIAEPHPPSTSQAVSITEAGTRLSFIGSGNAGVDGSPIPNMILLVTVLLQAFRRMVRVSSQHLHRFIDLIHLAIRKLLGALEKVHPEGKPEPPKLRSTEHQDWYTHLKSQVDGLPEIDKDNDGDLDKLSASLDELDDNQVNGHQRFLAFSLSVVTQLYRFTLCLKSTSQSEESIVIDVSPEIEEATGTHTDHFFRQLGHLAASVIRSLHAEDQVQLKLVQEAFLLFTQPSGTQSRDSLFQTVAVVAGQEEPAQWSLCKDGHRTAPLVLGILQGLRPSAMQDLSSHRVLLDLSERLVTTQLAGISTLNRSSLDAMLTILSNKLPISSVEGVKVDRARLLRQLGDGFTRVVSRVTTQNAISAGELEPDLPTSLEIFRSVLHFLAGDIANYQPRIEDNPLLRLVADTAPAEPTIGRQLSQCFEILVSPKNFLTKENHAITKRLRGQWIYNQVTKPFLDECFPRQARTGRPTINDRVATNRSVASFAVLRHLDCAVWRSESSKILLVVIRSLQTFGVSQDMNTVLDILLKILDSDPDLVKEHLKTLITHTLAVYVMVRNIFDTTEFVNDRNPNKLFKREADMCRKSCLEFLRRLPKTFDSLRHNLLPQRQAVLRGLSTACGDPVREVREVAIVARRDWEALS